MNYRGYTLELSTQTHFGSRIVFIKQRGLTTEKAIGATVEAVFMAAKVWIDWRLSNET